MWCRLQCIQFPSRGAPERETARHTRQSSACFSPPQAELSSHAPAYRRRSSTCHSPPQAELSTPQPAAGGAQRASARRRRSSARHAELSTPRGAPHASARRRLSSARPSTPHRRSSADSTPQPDAGAALRSSARRRRRTPYFSARRRRRSPCARARCKHCSPLTNPPQLAGLQARRRRRWPP